MNGQVDRWMDRQTDKQTDKQRKREEGGRAKKDNQFAIGGVLHKWLQTTAFICKVQG